jgi:hypothetical protein
MGLPHRFQRKSWESRQYVTGSESLQANPKRAMCEAVRVKPQASTENLESWKFQELETSTKDSLGQHVEPASERAG